MAILAILVDTFDHNFAMLTLISQATIESIGAALQNLWGSAEAYEISITFWYKKQRNNYSVIKPALTHRFCRVSRRLSGWGGDVLETFLFQVDFSILTIPQCNACKIFHKIEKHFAL